MRPDFISSVRGLMLLASLATPLAMTGCAGCDGNPVEDDGTDPTTTSSSSSGTGGGAGPVGPPASPKARVQFKNGTRLKQELSRVLDIAPNQLCQELGKFDCFGLHQVVLGDTAAFGAGIYEPLPASTATSPIAVDRVVLAACGQRAEADLEGSDPLIYKNLPITDGELTDIEADEVVDAIEVLYQRSLGRDPKEHEVVALQDLYLEIAASGKSADPALDWAKLSCFATLTTMEMLFY